MIGHGYKRGVEFDMKLFCTTGGIQGLIPIGTSLRIGLSVELEFKTVTNLRRESKKKRRKSGRYSKARVTRR